MSYFIRSEHEPFKNRRGIFHRLKNNVSPINDLGGDKIPMEETGLRLNVDLERCVRCGKCEKVCPTGAIMVDEDIFRVDSSLCNRCGRCIDGCREAALSLGDNQEVFMN
jgi:ferredoxin